tara:strand:+ start:76 stop:381 length:306 start_codon:yes stop_codon:yes gene_type:complete
MIEKYIQFAIDNGYIYPWCDLIMVCAWDYDEDTCFNAEAECKEIITSKPFIEAIARGVFKKDLQVCDELYERKLDRLTSKQAIAIREGTLDKFIEKLLPKQ